MRYIYMLFFSVFFFNLAISQDLVVRANGDSLDCKITKIKNDRIFIRFYTESGYLMQLNYDMNDISSYTYAKDRIYYVASETQDTIYTNAGNVIVGKVKQNEDSVIVFSDTGNQRKKSTFHVSKVDSITSGGIRNVQAKEKIDMLSFGLGLGRDYGGIGG